MLFKEWNVLIVDDEPDVLSITKLALRHTTVYGLPINVHTAQSKAAAIELLNGKLTIPGVKDGSVAVAFIDVVMETDHAGLELCDYIRNTLQNRTVQLFVRTGQPGIAPERDVIDRYDISGYFTKVEATDDKLYTFVKSGIRQWYTYFYASTIADLTNLAITNSVTKQQLMEALGPQGEGFEDDGNVSGIMFDDVIMSFGEQVKVIALRDELSQYQPLFVSPEGHSFVQDGNRVMVRILPTETTCDYSYVIEGFTGLPDALLDITFRNGLALATLWKRAAD